MTSQRVLFRGDNTLHRLGVIICKETLRVNKNVTYILGEVTHSQVIWIVIFFTSIPNKSPSVSNATHFATFLIDMFLSILSKQYIYLIEISLISINQHLT